MALRYTENTKTRKRNICEQITGVRMGTKSNSNDIPDESLVHAESVQPPSDQSKELEATDEVTSQETETISTSQSFASAESALRTSAGPLMAAKQPQPLPTTTRPLPVASTTSQSSLDLSSLSNSKSGSGTVVFHINLAGSSNFNLNFR